MDATTPETVLTVRVPSLVASLDQEAARRRAASPGVRVTRADCVRALLLGALAALLPTREAA